MQRKLLILLAAAAGIAALIGIAIAVAKVYNDFKWKSRMFIKFEDEEKLDAFIKAAEILDPHSYRVPNTPMVLQVMNSDVLEALDNEVYGYKTLDQEEIGQVRQDMSANPDTLSWAE